MTTRITPFLCALSAVTGIAWAQAPTLDRMESLSREFVALENCLVEAKPKDERVEIKCDQLVGLLSKIEIPADVERRGRGPEFRRLAGEATRISTELAGYVKKHDHRFARIALEHLRVTCIACHIAVRSKNDAREWFPATKNTVWGRVSIRDLEGRKRRSGAGVTVFLDVVTDAIATRRPPPIIPRMSQRDQKFTPRVLPVVVGTKVVFPNDDRVFHNVFSLSKTKHFDLGVYGKGKTKDETFPKTGLVRIHCNIHSKMVATVLVLANPYFAVSDATGLYVITGIPDGEHTMRAWHEFGGGASRQLELRGGSVVEHSFEVRETKKTLPHKNKFGRPYRQKY